MSESVIPPTDDPDPASSTDEPAADNVIRPAAFGGSNEDVAEGSLALAGATSATDQPMPTAPPPFANLNGGQALPDDPRSSNC